MKTRVKQLRNEFACKRCAGSGLYGDVNCANCNGSGVCFPVGQTLRPVGWLIVALIAGSGIVAGITWLGGR